MATAAAATAKVLNIILMSSSFRDSATEPGADRLDKCFELFNVRFGNPNPSPSGEAKFDEVALCDDIRLSFHSA